jgi:hypothetical protein
MKRIPFHTILLLLSVLRISATPENPLIPETWFQEMIASDGSTQQCIIFTTVPGVEYTFFHSNELEEWTEIGKTYGLGQEFAAAMRETAPAPPRRSRRQIQKILLVCRRFSHTPVSPSSPPPTRMAEQSYRGLRSTMVVPCVT